MKQKDMKQKETPPAAALRWHLSRIYEEERFLQDRDRRVYVTVHRAAEPFQRQLRASTIAGLRSQSQEELSWWDRSMALEGWVDESTLIRQLADHNVTEIEEPWPEPKERRLAEEMVLLQLLPSEASWHKTIENAARDDDAPDLADLAEAEGSSWLDLTPAARRAAKRRYLRALRESHPSGEGGPHARKR
jgi:hypothetical protein